MQLKLQSELQLKNAFEFVFFLIIHSNLSFSRKMHSNLYFSREMHLIFSFPHFNETTSQVPVCIGIYVCCEEQDEINILLQYFTLN